MPYSITGRSGNNVYVNTNLSATLPLEVNQNNFNSPITVSLKGLNNMGSANKIIKVNSLGTQLEYADSEGSNWTVSGNNIYPTTASQILVNTTSNTNNYGLLVLDKEITVQNSANSDDIKGVRINYDTHSVINYVESNGDMKWEGATNMYNFDNKVKVNGDGEFTGQLTLSGSTPQLSNGIQTFSLPTSTSGALALFSQIPTNNNQLTNGSNYITASSITSLQNFGTSVAGGNTIKVGNSANTSQTTNVELYTAAHLKLFNTSGVLVAQFTPVSNTCDLNLNGGVLTNTTMGNNTVYNGSSISYQYGGTGISNLSGQAGKALVVNGTSNGYSFATIPSATTQYWSETNSVLSPLTSTNVIRGDSGFRVGSSTEFVDIDYNITTNNFSLTHSDGTVIYDYDNDTQTTKIAKLQTNSIEATNQSNNLLTSDSTFGWIMESNNPEFMFWLRRSGDISTSVFPILGNLTGGFQIHLNNVGDAYNCSSSRLHTFQGGALEQASTMFIGRTNGSYTSTINLYMLINHASGSNTSATFLGFLYAGTLIGEVHQSGTTAVVYKTTSDYRLKENVIDCGNMLNIIDKMKVKEYNFINDRKENIDQKYIGLIAHEVQELDDRFNSFVSGEKDEISNYCKCCDSFYCKGDDECKICDDDGCMINMEQKEKYQGIDYGKLTPIAIKGIQELHTIIKSQQKEINTLKTTVDKLINSKSFAEFKKQIK